MMIENNTLCHQLDLLLAQRTPSLMDASAHFAVLVPLVMQDNQLHLLYELRAAKLRSQPNEICFPGGKMELGESPLDAALRETQEELGIPSSAITILGALDFIAHRANFILHPILAVIDSSAVECLIANPDEVDSTILVPLSHLLDNPPSEYHYALIPEIATDFPYDILGISQDYNWRSGYENIPVYPLDGNAIWGITGRITRHLCTLITEQGLTGCNHV